MPPSRTSNKCSSIHGDQRPCQWCARCPGMCIRGQPRPPWVYRGSQEAGPDQVGSSPASEENESNVYFSCSAAMWKEADEEVNQLFALMVQVREKMDRKCPEGHKQRTSLNLRQCTWEQVMVEVQSLTTRWSTSPKRSSKMMISLEKLGQNSDVFKSWLELLPAGDYGSRYAGDSCAPGLSSDVNPC